MLKQDEEKLLGQLRALPQKYYRMLCGDRTTKVLNEQAERYGIPFGGPTVNLFDAVRGLHDFLSKNGPLVRRTDRAASPNAFDQDGESSPGLERKRMADAEKAEITVARMKRQLLEREKVQMGHREYGARLKKAGEVLEKRFGREAYLVLEDAMEDASRIVRRILNSDDDSDSE